MEMTRGNWALWKGAGKIHCSGGGNEAGLPERDDAASKETERVMGENSKDLIGQSSTNDALAPQRDKKIPDSADIPRINTANAMIGKKPTVSW